MGMIIMYSVFVPLMHTFVNTYMCIPYVYYIIHYDLYICNCMVQTQYSNCDSSNARTANVINHCYARDVNNCYLAAT